MTLSHIASSWFASFGEDYKNPCHVLQRNRWLKTIRRRVIGGKGKWEYVFPQHFVSFTMGFDDDYDCFDLSTLDGSTGEYNIIYWAPPRIFGKEPQLDFCSYMENNLKFWNK